MFFSIKLILNSNIRKIMTLSKLLLVLHDHNFPNLPMSNHLQTFSSNHLQVLSISLNSKHLVGLNQLTYFILLLLCPPC